MSFFEQVNGKTVDEYVSDVANGKTPAIAVSRRDFNADQYKALCEAIRNSKAVNNVFLSDISDEAEIKMLFDAIASNGNIEKLLCKIRRWATNMSKNSPICMSNILC